MAGLPIDIFAREAEGSIEDMANIFTGVQQLRYVEGEKHLLFFTEFGFTIINGLHAGKLLIAIFYADAHQNFLGEDWQNMDMQLHEETYQRFMQSAIPFSATIPLKARTQILKVVVYDPVGDRLGSRLVRIKQ